jgi:hypothetical protein
MFFEKSVLEILSLKGASTCAEKVTTFQATKPSLRYPIRHISFYLNRRPIPQLRIKESRAIGPSQVKLLITTNAFCIVQRATAQSKTEFFVVMV